MDLLILLVVFIIVISLAGLLARKLWKTLFSKEIVFEYERALLFKNGKLEKMLEPGAHWIRPTFMQVIRVDIRPRFIQVVGQEVLTSDNVPLKLSIVGHFKVTDAHTAILNSDSYTGALYMVLQLAARDVIAKQSIDDILSRRSDFGPQILEIAKEQSHQLGVELTSVSVKDLMLSGELKRAFAQVVKARKDGEAALEKARGETAALRNLANAARLIEGNPHLLQLRMLQSLSDSTGNTLVLGLPNGATPVPVKSKGPQTSETHGSSGSRTEPSDD